MALELLFNQQVDMEVFVADDDYWANYDPSKPCPVLWLGPDWARPGYVEPPVEQDPESIHDRGWFKTHPENPGRSPAWRWLRAGMVAKRSVPKFRAWDDDAVRDALDFRRGLESGEPNLQAAAVAKWPSFYAALQVYNEAGPQQWELEARVLAAQDHAEIATKVGLPVDVVDAYVLLFYDVESRLKCRSYVHLHLIGSHESTYDLRTCWAYHAYVAGPYSIDLLVEALHPVRGTATQVDYRDLSHLTDAELSAHQTWLTGQLETTTLKQHRHLLALQWLQKFVDRVKRTFVAPHPTPSELESQLSIGREELEAEIASTHIPVSAPLKKVM